jgi:serine/threonine protein kinase
MPNASRLQRLSTHTTMRVRGAARFRPRKRFHIGAEIGRYIVTGILGEGATATVYRALDSDLARPVAIKVFDRSSQPLVALRQLRSEGRHIAKVLHRNVIEVFDCGVSLHGTFVVVELLDGRSLRQALSRRHYSNVEILRFFHQAASGLAAIHRSDVIHSDVKIENMVLTSDGTLKMVDFGLARRICSSLDEDSWTQWTGLPDWSFAALQPKIGTPAFLAPECYAGYRPTTRSDVFSLCASFYEVFCGERPYPGKTMREIYTSFANPQFHNHPVFRQLPANLRRALRNGLDPNPAQRTIGAEQLADAITYEQNRWTRRAGALFAIAALTTSLFVGASSVQEPEIDCAAPPKQRLDVWNPKIANDLAAHFDVKDDVRSTFHSWSNAMRQWAEEWDEVHHAVCQANTANVSPHLRKADAAMTCLRRSSKNAEAVVRALRGIDRWPKEAWEALAEQAGHPRECHIDSHQESSNRDGAQETISDIVLQLDAHAEISDRQVFEDALDRARKHVRNDPKPLDAAHIELAQAAFAVRTIDRRGAATHYSRAALHLLASGETARAMVAKSAAYALASERAGELDIPDVHEQLQSLVAVMPHRVASLSDQAGLLERSAKSWFNFGMLSDAEPAIRRAEWMYSHQQNGTPHHAVALTTLSLVLLFRNHIAEALESSAAAHRIFGRHELNTLARVHYVGAYPRMLRWTGRYFQSYSIANQEFERLPQQTAENREMIYPLVHIMRGSLGNAGLASSALKQHEKIIGLDATINGPYDPLTLENWLLVAELHSTLGQISQADLELTKIDAAFANHPSAIHTEVRRYLGSIRMYHAWRTDDRDRFSSGCVDFLTSDPKTCDDLAKWIWTDEDRSSPAIATKYCEYAMTITEVALSGIIVRAHLRRNDVAGANQCFAVVSAMVGSGEFPNDPRRWHLDQAQALISAHVGAHERAQVHFAAVTSRVIEEEIDARFVREWRAEARQASFAGDSRLAAVDHIRKRGAHTKTKIRSRDKR